MNRQQETVQELTSKLAMADPSFMETAIFLAIFMCIFIVVWSIKNLIQGKTKSFEFATTENVDAKLTVAMVIVGVFMMLCAIYIIFAGFM